MANPSCPACFDSAPLSLECVDLLDAAAKSGFSAETLRRWALAGTILAKRVASGTGVWRILLDARGLPVDPPECPHRVRQPHRAHPTKPAPRRAHVRG